MCEQHAKCVKVRSYVIRFQFLVAIYPKVLDRFLQNLVEVWTIDHVLYDRNLEQIHSQLPKQTEVNQIHRKTVIYYRSEHNISGSSDLIST